MTVASTNGVVSAAEGSSRVLAAIEAKRAGRAMSGEQIAVLIQDFVGGRIPDYQMAAWLATVACSGMTLAETIALTRAYVDGGARLDLHDVGRVVVDKHSTGGVGDKVSLIVVPVVAACGVAVAKMSGRGLSYAGGTIDKLESINGLRLDLSPSEIECTVRDVGMVITGQSEELVPGEKATYALRDVTGTVESIPLIAASIISKKAAVRADGLLLDVKTGTGALIADRALAGQLAETMVAVAREFGLRCRAVLSDMSQPLGYAVGNALEVKEALEVLSGRHVPGLSDLCLVLAQRLLQLADPGLGEADAHTRVAKVLADGTGYELFVRWAAEQGADVQQLVEPERLPACEHRSSVTADRTGWVNAVHPRSIGMAAVRVGAGRLVHDAPLDYGAGVVLQRRVGDMVAAGDVIAEVHHSSSDASVALELARSAFLIGDEAAVPPPIVHQEF